jgi:hypothetical protein
LVSLLSGSSETMIAVERSARAIEHILRDGDRAEHVFLVETVPTGILPA